MPNQEELEESALYKEIRSMQRKEMGEAYDACSAEPQQEQKDEFAFPGDDRFTELEKQYKEKRRKEAELKKDDPPKEPAPDWREVAKDHLATALAYDYIAQQYAGDTERYDKMSLDQQREFLKQVQAEAKEQKEKVKKDPAFYLVFNNLDREKICDMMVQYRFQEAKTDGVFSYTKFQEEYHREIKARGKEIGKEIGQEKERVHTKNLVDDLVMSTKKTTAGSLKNALVGDSKSYKDAFRALETFSNGGFTSDEAREEARAEAVEAMRSYVLSHATTRSTRHGRERFDAFMKGCAELMEPRDFNSLCGAVNEIRNNHGDHTHDIKLGDYLVTAASKERFSAWSKKVEKLKTMENRARNKEIAEQEHKEAAKLDEEKIKRDEESTADKKGRSLAERNQMTLDFLRGITEKNRPTNDQQDILNTRLRVHPAFRLVAEKIIEEKNLQDLFHVPKTYTEHMSEDAQKKLKAQVEDLKELDRQKHPDLYQDEPEPKKTTTKQQVAG